MPSEDPIVLLAQTVDADTPRPVAAALFSRLGGNDPAALGMLARVAPDVAVDLVRSGGVPERRLVELAAEGPAALAGQLAGMGVAVDRALAGRDDLDPGVYVALDVADVTVAYQLAGNPAAPAGVVADAVTGQLAGPAGPDRSLVAGELAQTMRNHPGRAADGFDVLAAHPHVLAELVTSGGFQGAGRMLDSGRLGALVDLAGSHLGGHECLKALAEVLAAPAVTAEIVEEVRTLAGLVVTDSIRSLFERISGMLDAGVPVAAGPIDPWAVAASGTAAEIVAAVGVLDRCGLPARDAIASNLNVDDAGYADIAVAADRAGAAALARSMLHMIDDPAVLVAAVGRCSDPSVSYHQSSTEAAAQVAAMSAAEADRLAGRVDDGRVDAFTRWLLSTGYTGALPERVAAAVTWDMLARCTLDVQARVVGALLGDLLADADPGVLDAVFDVASRLPVADVAGYARRLTGTASDAA